MTAPQAFTSARLSLLLCFIVVPAVGLAQKPQKQSTHRPLRGVHERAFLAQAIADDAMQIALARLAMMKSSNPRLRALASKIVSDHAALDLQFSRLAANSGSKGHAHDAPARDIIAMQAHLQSLQGEAFDRAFVGTMVKEHHKIIAAYAVAAKTSADDKLRTIAARGLPVLQGHLDAARSLMKEASLAQQGREHR
ncbi:DUF4142 domain-containing protein [Dyella flagellata]|uniref:DUF4142 domain-containing protein n=1 Tax=Dyella flagellata TaxID=1867833 RepID=A0ABQ5XDP0_9GAMM|nr:DUF4142 domain-containing protein [Dyella flagellata]GLQ89334.1 hypothetical protein GCM10007898_29070 [Dyella flagellata]